MRKRFSRHPAIVAAAIISVCLFLLFTSPAASPECFDDDEDCKDFAGTKHGLVAELSVRFFGFRQKSPAVYKATTTTASATTPDIHQNTSSATLADSLLTADGRQAVLPPLEARMESQSDVPVSDLGEVKSSVLGSRPELSRGAQNSKQGMSDESNLMRQEISDTVSDFASKTSNETTQKYSPQALTSQTININTAGLVDIADTVNERPEEHDYEKQPEENGISELSAQREEDQEEYPIADQKVFPVLDGAIVPAKSLGTSDATCAHHSCVVKNACVDHAQGDTWFTLDPVDFEPLEFLLKGHNYTLTMSYREALPPSVKMVNGTTHLFTIDFTNWFFTILRSFSYYKNVEMHTGLDNEFNAMILFQIPFAVDLSQPFYHVFRAVHPHYAPLYDLRKSLHGGETSVTCFERAVFGFEYRGSMMSAFAEEHLNQIVERLTTVSMTRDDANPATQLRAQRYLELNSTLATDLQAFQKFLLRRFHAEHIAMKPRTAILVDRLLGRKGALAPYRRIINRHELEAVLKDEGFKVTVVEFANLTIPEQIRLARETSLFVAMHGAGVTNAFWMHNTGCLLEMHTYNFQKWGYETMASYLGLPYVSWVNTREDHTRETWHSIKSEKTINFWRSRDQWVDKAEFRQAVRDAKKKLRMASLQSHDQGE